MARGRKPGYHMSPEHRDKIKNSNILNALINHVEGKLDMTSTQVTAGIALLKKVMPDTQSIDISGQGESGEIEHVVKVVREIVHPKDPDS